MHIINLPIELQPRFELNSKNVEVVCFDYFNNFIYNSDYIYIPIFWSSIILNNHIDIINNFLNKLDKSKKYFTITQNSYQICLNIYNLNLTVFTTSSYTITSNIQSNIHTYIIPFLHYPLIKNKNKNKILNCSYINLDSSNDIYNDVYNNIFNAQTYNINTTDVLYTEILNQSIYCICPIKYGQSSSLICDAIMCNCIPIIIYDDICLLPYTDIINWCDFSIIINKKDILNFTNIISNYNINNMLQNLKKNKSLFIFEIMCKYILSKIKNN